MKEKKRFVCKECGFVSFTWLGKCPECDTWNSLIEEVVQKIGKKETDAFVITKIEEIEYQTNAITKLKNPLVNDFFGDGIVSGSVFLLAGEPGIGKSTFLFFMTGLLYKSKVFYFSGEESSEQIKRRYDRVGENNCDIFVSNTGDIDSILSYSDKNKPDFIFIDSIQTCFSRNIDSSPGTISQIKYCSNALMEFAKKNGITIVIVCHVTKSGEIAGPKLIEHIVDVVIYFEGEYRNQYRILRSKKNRFGNIDEILLFEMQNDGLKLIDNPSSLFIESNEELSNVGKCKSVIVEGKRPIIIEVEVLVVPSSYPNPRRISEGIDASRLNRIIAILDKHLNENFNNYDVYFNISGGIKTQDVGIDFAVAAALFSSKNKKPIKNNNVFIGELSLTGKIKNIYKSDIRTKEAIKFNCNKIYSPLPADNSSDCNHISILKEIFI